MHIFFLTHWFPTYAAPIYGIFILEHALAAAQHHQVSLLHILGLDQHLNRDYVITVENYSSNLTIYHLSYRNLLLPKTAWLQQIRGSLEVYEMATKMYGAPRVIHANIANTAGLAYILRQIKKTPAILSEHSSAWPRNLYTRRQIRTYSWFLNRLDLLLPVTHDLQVHMQSKGIHNRFKVLPNTVNNEIFYPDVQHTQATPHSLKAITVGRLDKNKATHLLIEVLAQMKSEGVTFYLEIIGDGPERPLLEKQSQDLGVRDEVCFKGLQEKHTIAERLKQADFFVISSLWENQPVVLLEALATGLPVIAPAVGGIPEIINAKDAPIVGKLFKAGDVVDLRIQINSLIKEIGQYNRAAISAYANSEFGHLAIGQKLDTIYNQVSSKSIL